MKTQCRGSQTNLERAAILCLVPADNGGLDVGCGFTENAGAPSRPSPPLPSALASHPYTTCLLLLASEFGTFDLEKYTC